MSWGEGYVTEVDYTPGYIAELNPVRAALPLLMAGVAPPTVETACELGFGLGVSLAVHAAAGDTQWWGADYNPSHAAHARKLVRASGAAARAEADAFADFCRRDDLPDFDFIGLHGVWSWVDADNRRLIADFIARKLRVGGLVYISYNCMPGWSAFAPVRHLIWQFVQRQSAPGIGMKARLEAALANIDALIEADPAFFRAMPLALDRYKLMRGLDRRYLIHELMTHHWRPEHIADMASALESARLTFVGGAHPIDHVDAMNLSAPQAAMLAGTTDPIHRETLRDCFTNQQFRRDYWMKGPTRLDGQTLGKRLSALRLTGLKPRAEIRLKARAARGDIGLKETAFAPLADLIAAQPGVSLGDLAALGRTHDLSFTHCVEAAALFVANGDVGVCAQPSASALVRSERYNRALAADDAGHARDDLMQLACATTGGGAPVTRTQLLVLQALWEGHADSQAQADAVLKRLIGGLPVTRAGPDADRQAVLAAASDVAARLPLWRALGAIGGSAAAPTTAHAAVPAPSSAAA